MIELVIERRSRDLGGFIVGRVLPFAERRMVGPFIFFDHMGPLDLPRGIPRKLDVRPHPHIGLSTVTYLFAGEIVHRDSIGSELSIRPGEVNWMIAGRGITHSERFEKARAEGDHLHGIQAWVALPNKDEECEPAFFHYAAEGLPAAHANDVHTRLIAGSLARQTSPVKTTSPLFYVHAEMQPGGVLALPPEYSERAAYVARGAATMDGQPIALGQMAVFAPGGTIKLEATEPSTIMLLGGEPIGERFIEWNFVSSSRDRIEQAKADWRAGRMKLPIHDQDEFTPLPETPR